MNNEHIEKVKTNERLHNVYVSKTFNGLLIGSLGALSYILDFNGKKVSKGYHEFYLDGSDLYGKLGAKRNFVMSRHKMDGIVSGYNEGGCNMNDLEWLARNVSEWPTDAVVHYLCVNGDVAVASNAKWDGCYDEQQWQQKREELGLGKVTLKKGDYVKVARAADAYTNRICDIFNYALGGHTFSSEPARGYFTISSNSDCLRELTPDQVLNATNAQPHAQVIKVDDGGDEDKIPVATHEAWHGGEWRKCIMLGFDIFGAHVYQITEGEFRGELNGDLDERNFRLIKSNRDKAIDKVADFLNCGPFSRDNIHAKEIATALAEKGFLQLSED